MRVCVYLVITLCFLSSSAIADISLTTNRAVHVPLGAIDSLISKSTQSEELKAAALAFNNRNLPECEKLLDEARAKDASLPSGQILLARFFSQSGNMNEAVTRIEKYLIESPRDPIAFLTLAELALKSARWTDAWLELQHAEQLVAENPTQEDPTVLSLRVAILGLQGEVAANRRQWVEAEDLFSQWAKLQPTESAPVWSIGKLKMLKGDLDGALEKLREARVLEPKLQQPELAIAIHLATNPESTDSEKWFQDGIKANDSTVDNWIAYLRWLLTKDRAADVEKIVAKLKTEYKSQRDIKFLAAFACRFLNKNAEAEKGFSEIHQSNPEDLEAADQLALVLVESSDEGKRARAQQLSEANLRRAPNVETIAATAAWVQFKLGAVDVADRMLGEMASKIALTPQTAYYIGQLLKSKGKEAEAKMVLETAVKSPGLFVQRSKVLAELLQKEDKPDSKE